MKCNSNAIEVWDQIKQSIRNARESVYRKVNEELIQMYWTIGEQLSEEKKKSNFGDAYIDNIARHINQEFPELKGFTRRGLYRMIQFYETYKDDTFVSSLLTQVNWTNHLAILSKANSLEERHFYLTLCIKESYSSRELSRQIDSAYYERYMLSENKLLTYLKGEKDALSLLDTYVFDFLNLPKRYKEKDLRDGIIEQMKSFILEIGKDFSFIGKEYKIEVGNRDFFIDLLFFHRGLRCLVAFELKIGQFEPEFISKMDFYLEALDRQKRKEGENPSVGVILCSYKDDEVVEYALSRTLSPTMVANYTIQLPDKEILQRKLKEITLLSQTKTDTSDLCQHC
jgi:hypothetical protein